MKCSRLIIFDCIFADKQAHWMTAPSKTEDLSLGGEHTILYMFVCMLFLSDCWWNFDVWLNVCGCDCLIIKKKTSPGQNFCQVVASKTRHEKRSKMSANQIYPYLSRVIRKQYNQKKLDFIVILWISLIVHDPEFVSSLCFG